MKALKMELPDDLKTALEQWLAVKDKGDESLKAAERSCPCWIKLSVQQPVNPPVLAEIKARRPAAERSIWIIGGDGWAYDIGYGGLDHVLAPEPM